MSHTPTLTRFRAWLEPRPMGLGEPNGGLSRRSKPEPNEDEPAPPYRSRSPWATDGKHRKKKLHRWSQQRRLLRWWRARSMPVEPIAASCTGRRKSRRTRGPTRWPSGLLALRKPTTGSPRATLRLQTTQAKPPRCEGFSAARKPCCMGRYWPWSAGAPRGQSVHPPTGSSDSSFPA